MDTLNESFIFPGEGNTTVVVQVEIGMDVDAKARVDILEAFDQFTQDMLDANGQRPPAPATGEADESPI